MRGGKRQAIKGTEIAQRGVSGAKWRELQSGELRETRSARGSESGQLLELSFKLLKRAELEQKVWHRASRGAEEGGPCNPKKRGRKKTSEHQRKTSGKDA